MNWCKDRAAALRPAVVLAGILSCWTVALVIPSGPVLHAGEPVQAEAFERAGIVQAWERYGDRLTFGKGQTLALVDDGCTLSKPEWSQSAGDQPKVRVAYDSVDGDNDPSHEGRGYHGSTIGIPSSLNYQGKWGVAYNDQVAVIRALECCHCKLADGDTLAAGLQWIIDHHQEHQITTVNLAPVDDLAHDKPIPTAIDAKLKRLRALGIWVSAPAGNHNYTNGISWPASQPNCFAIGAVKQSHDEVYLDRHAKVDLVVPAAATSSSNAIACGAAIVLREAIQKAGYDWKADGPNLVEAMLSIMQKTGVPVDDPATGLTFRRLNLVAALDHVFTTTRISLWNGHAPVGDGRPAEGDAWITVHRPAKSNGTAIVICPGGGYGGLVTGAEGHGIASWLNGHGITGVVLEYRLPKGRYMVPLLDAQRAIRTVRANATAWSLDPQRIGIMGFSAGGHLAATAGTHFDGGDANAADAVDRQGCRPDFLVLVYPVIKMDETTHQGSKRNLFGDNPSPELLIDFSNEKQVTAETPPTFLAHAKDDKPVPCEHSQVFHAALSRHNVPTRYLELPSGGHGLNGYQGPMWDAWQTQSLEWLRKLKLVP